MQLINNYPWRDKEWDFDLFPEITFSKMEIQPYEFDYILSFSWLFWTLFITLKKGGKN